MVRSICSEVAVLLPWHPGFADAEGCTRTRNRLPTELQTLVLPRVASGTRPRRREDSSCRDDDLDNACGTGGAGLRH